MMRPGVLVFINAEKLVNFIFTDLTREDKE